MSARLLPVFTVAFAIVYSVAFVLRIRYVVYYPNAGLWKFAIDPAQPAPGMYYYGWIVMGTVGALIACIIFAPIVNRGKWSVPSALVWIIPMMALPLLAIVYGHRFNLW